MTKNSRISHLTRSRVLAALLVLAITSLLLVAAFPMGALAASGTLENSVIQVVYNDYLDSGEFDYGGDNHMSSTQMGLKYDGGAVTWFNALTVLTPLTTLEDTPARERLWTQLRTPDNRLRLDMMVTLLAENPYFTVNIDAVNISGGAIGNLALFLASDEDIYDPSTDKAEYISQIDAVVAYDRDNPNIYLGFAGGLLSAAHDVNSAWNMWGDVEADALNNLNSYGTADVGIAEKWNLGTIAVAQTASVAITWAFGASLDEFKGNIIAADSTAPTIRSDTLVSPNGGESWQAGSTHTITWNAAHITDPTLRENPITLSYYDGASWVEIATDEANDGSYTWPVPSLDISTAKVKVTATDQAANSASDESDANFSIDSSDPTVALSYAPDRAVRDADTLVITATFSEAMAASPTIAIDTSGSDLPATAMSIGANSTLWTYSYDVPAGSDGTATVTISGTDLAGNPNQAATNNTFTIDNIAPNVSLGYSLNRAVRDADTLLITATFSEAMAASSTIAIDTSGSDLPATPMTMGADNTIWTYSYNVPAGSNGAATVTISGTDLATNPNQAATNNTFTIDNTAPTLSAANIVGTTRQGQGDTIVLTFSEPVVSADGAWSANDLTIESPNGAALNITNASFSYLGNALTITLDEAIDGTYLRNGNAVAVTPAPDKITDAAGNPLASVEVVSATAASGDYTAPTVSLTYAPDRPVKDADTLVITATFSEAMTSSTPTIAIDTTELDLAATPMTMGANNTIWTYSYNVPPGSNGTATVTVLGDDLAGNLNQAATNNTFTIDNTAPALSAANIVGTTRQGQGDTIVLTFSEPVVAADGSWSANDLSIESPDGAALNITNASFSYAGNSLTITLNEATDGAYLRNGNAVAVTPAPDTVTDAAENPLASVEVVSATAASGDSAPPTVALTYDPDRPVKDADTLLITATFSEAMTSSTPTIAIDTSGVDLTATPMTMGANNTIWTYGYDVPAGSNGTATVTVLGDDLAGNLNQAATNNTFTIDNIAPTLSAANIVGTTRQGQGDTIVLTFSEPVVAADGNWSANDLSIESPDGAALNITNASFSYAGNSLTITLDEATDGAYLRNGNAVAVTPAPDTITDAAGNPLASVEVVSATAASGDSVRPTVALTYLPDRPVKDADTLLITATFSEAMTSSTPTIAIDTTGSDLPATAMSIGANNTIWTYSYDVPAGSDGTATVTISGDDLAGNLNQAATNDTFTIDNTAPTLSAANIVGTTRQGQGDTIVLTFSEPVVAADGTWSANDLAIESPDGAALNITNASFSYLGNALTITLNEATDNSYLAYLVNGNTIAVTPGLDTIKDAAESSVASVKVVGTTPSSGDSVRPTATLAYSLNRPVRDADVLVLTATFSEAMTAAPIISVDTPGPDLAAAMTMMANNTLWTYTYDVPAVVDGPAIVLVYYGTDLAGNLNQVTFNNTFTIDNIAPTLPPANIVGTTRQGQGDTIALIFSEPVVAADGTWSANEFSAMGSPDGTPVSFANAAFSYAGSTLTITLSEATDGAYLVNGNTIAVTPAPDKIKDAAGNSLASVKVVGTTPNSGDSAPPTAVLTYSLNRPVRDADTLLITATFSEAMTSSTPTIAINTTGVDLAATPMTIGANSTVWTYSYNVPAGSDGTATITISGPDLAGNPNLVAANNTFTIDNTPPGVLLSSGADDPTSASPIPVTATFDEAVTGFNVQDITVGNGVAGDFTAASSTVYTFNVTPAGPGVVTVGVAAGAAQDAAGNGNAPASPLTRTFLVSPRLAVTSPNGGETWVAGAKATITWSSVDLRGKVKIELSRNGGQTWTTISRGTSNDGKYTWTVSEPVTTWARVRITSTSHPEVSDTSNANFAITGPTLTVTSPNGGETWAVGSKAAIRWSSVGLKGRVRIEISRDGGQTWSTIVSSTPNDGGYTWKVNGSATEQARIRITSTSTPAASDTSDADFTIAGR